MPAFDFSRSNARIPLSSISKVANFDDDVSDLDVPEPATNFAAQGGMPFSFSTSETRMHSISSLPQGQSPSQGSVPSETQQSLRRKRRFDFDDSDDEAPQQGQGKENMPSQRPLRGTNDPCLIDPIRHGSAERRDAQEPSRRSTHLGGPSQQVPELQNSFALQDFDGEVDSGDEEWGRPDPSQVKSHGSWQGVLSSQALSSQRNSFRTTQQDLESSNVEGDAPAPWQFGGRNAQPLGGTDERFANSSAFYSQQASQPKFAPKREETPEQDSGWRWHQDSSSTQPERRSLLDLLSQRRSPTPSSPHSKFALGPDVLASESQASAAPRGRRRIPGPACDQHGEDGTSVITAAAAQAKSQTEEDAGPIITLPLLKRRPVPERNDPDFASFPWRKMLQDLDVIAPGAEGCSEAELLASCHFRTPIVKVVREAYLKKVPRLVVLVKAINVGDDCADALIKDPTGEMRATVHGKVLEEEGDDLARGSGLVLRKVTVFNSYNGQSHLAIITPNNVVRCYPPAATALA